jgi:hypothetical protein
MNKSTALTIVVLAILTLLGCDSPSKGKSRPNKNTSKTSQVEQPSSEPVPAAGNGRVDGYGGVYSTGFRMGQLTKASVKGLAVDSCEAQLLMGKEGTPYTKTVGSGKEAKEVVINPWYFSADKAECSTLSNASGYVWVSYNQARMKPLDRDTEYTFTGMGKVTRTIPNPAVCEAKKSSGGKSDGFRLGRIVKASNKGHISSSWEIILQQGESGNQFKMMSILEQELYECAVNFLKSGKAVKAYYKEAFITNPLDQDSAYDVWKIEANVEESL